jgi:hypothetical protein
MHPSQLRICAMHPSTQMGATASKRADAQKRKQLEAITAPPPWGMMGARAVQAVTKYSTRDVPFLPQIPPHSLSHPIPLPRAVPEWLAHTVPLEWTDMPDAFTVKTPERWWAELLTGTATREWTHVASTSTVVTQGWTQSVAAFGTSIRPQDGVTDVYTMQAVTYPTTTAFLARGWPEVVALRFAAMLRVAGHAPAAGAFRHVQYCFPSTRLQQTLEHGWVAEGPLVSVQPKQEGDPAVAAEVDALAEAYIRDTGPMPEWDERARDWVRDMVAHRMWMRGAWSAVAERARRMVWNAVQRQDRTLFADVPQWGPYDRSTPGSVVEACAPSVRMVECLEYVIMRGVPRGAPLSVVSISTTPNVANWAAVSSSSSMGTVVFAPGSTEATTVWLATALTVWGLHAVGWEHRHVWPDSVGVSLTQDAECLTWTEPRFAEEEGDAFRVVWDDGGVRVDVGDWGWASVIPDVYRVPDVWPTDAGALVGRAPYSRVVDEVDHNGTGSGAAYACTSTMLSAAQQERVTEALVGKRTWREAFSAAVAAVVETLPTARICTCPARSSTTLMLAITAASVAQQAEPEADVWSLWNA